MDEALLCDRVAVLRVGRVIACAPPRELLARGATQLLVGSGHEQVRSTIGSRPEDLATALRQFGLRGDIDAVEVVPDSLETVLLRLIDQQGAEGSDL